MNPHITAKIKAIRRLQEQINVIKMSVPPGVAKAEGMAAALREMPNDYIEAYKHRWHEAFVSKDDHWTSETITNDIGRPYGCR